MRNLIVVAALFAAASAQNLKADNPINMYQESTSTTSSSSSSSTETIVDENGNKVTRKVIVIEETVSEDEIEGEAPCKSNIVAAVWGMKEVTEAMQKKYDEGQHKFEASNEEWGEGWASYKKTLDVVYDTCGNFASVSTREGGAVSIP